MIKQALRLTALASAMTAALTLSGCSYLGIDFTQDKVQYESSSSRANLEVPPDLSPIARDDRFDVPSRARQSVSANEEMARQLAAGERQAQTGDIVPKTVTAKLMRDGSERWLRVTAPAEKLWSVVQDFWPSVGLVLSEQDPKTGVMITGWAENKAKLPQDVIRATLGKVLDFAYSTGERDQYRCRLERNDDGTTDIFIVHRSMVEVLKGNQGDSTIWQPGPTDTTLEVEMLQRLAQRIDAEFNPDAKPLDKETLQKQVIASDKPVEPASQLIKDEHGLLEGVVLKEPFDRAWRTIGLVIDRMGFELVDRDRAAGYFMVRYLDPKYEEKKKSEQGFFKNLFGSDKAVEAPSYRIQLTDDGDTTRISVLSAEGYADMTGVAPTILTLLAEQTR